MNKRVNTVKELNTIIRTGKRDIKNYMESGWNKSDIFSYIELIKKDCNKYSESNQTTRNIYSGFLYWLKKIDRQLFPEFY